MKNILILAPYPIDRAPSQRFRFEHFLKFMEEKGFSYDFQSFLSVNAWNHLYEQGNSLVKLASVVRGFARRILVLFRLRKYDYVLIHREATPLGPPLFEWVIARLLQKSIIYDFDDAIWMADQGGENTLWKTLKWRSKVGTICSFAHGVSAGNDYLAGFAESHCKHVRVLPTVINSDIHQRDEQKSTLNSSIPIIGWTGSHSTLFYLDQLLPVLLDLERSCEFEFLVIANKNPRLPLKNFQFIPWNKESEIEDLAQINIGVMPLEGNEWSKGKCGFKLIQYLALGIPAVASPVGVNPEIVRDGHTGFLASTHQEWLLALEQLLKNPELRLKLGRNGRGLILDKYSVVSQVDRFFQLFP